MRALVKRLLDRAPDAFYLRVMHYVYLPISQRRWPGRLRLRRPRSWSDKIRYLGMHIERLIPDAHVYADKLAVRDYVAATIGSQHLVPVIAIWDDPDDIDWDVLPDRFMLKTNHGSGFVLPVPDKTALNTAEATATLSTWLETDYSRWSREQQYRNIPRRVFAEELLDVAQASVQYRFHCFSGLVRHTQARDRGSGMSVYLDQQWRLLPFRRSSESAWSGAIPDRPRLLDEMSRMAEHLARPFPYVRVDFYEVDRQVLFAELTFTPGSGKPYRPLHWNRALGDLIELPPLQ